MQTKANKRKAINNAKKVLKEFGSDTPPINLIELLKFLDLQYLKFNPEELKLRDTDPHKVSAFINYTENIIMYNQEHPKTRLRFSIGHEIGHYILGHKSKPHTLNYSPKDPLELEANIFSAELLMPSHRMLREVIKNQNDLRRLAEKYEVSYKAMYFRVVYDNKLLGVSYDYNTLEYIQDDDI